MLEALAHQQLKALLRLEGETRWPHHLTLSRLAARSLRRSDQTLVRLAPGSDPSWLLALLVPIALTDTGLALVVSEGLRQRLLQVELPRLQAAGLTLPCWEGPAAPPQARLWLLDHHQLVQAWRAQALGARQLVIPEAENLELLLRSALGLVIENHDWEVLRRSLPAASTGLLGLHERLSRRIFAHPQGPVEQVGVSPEEEAPLRQLLALMEALPEPWSQWLASGGSDWVSWATVNPSLLRWQLHRQPLDPLAALAGLFADRGALLVGELPSGGRLGSPGNAGSRAGFRPQVEVALGDPPLQDPLPVFAPAGQPLPNSPHFASHLLDQARRLVLGQEGLTLVLLDDDGLRRGLTSGLAAEFGSRVVHQDTAPDSNGVICASWGWWLDQQARLPAPCQVIACTLPLASLESPLTAAQVQALRQQGRDWFRELLLPEALGRLQRAVANLRRSGGRLAVLDGRMRRRGWGRQVMTALEPWVALPRLLPR